MAHLVSAASMVVARATCAQIPAPMAVHSAPVTNVRTVPGNPDDYGVGPAPWVLLGTAVGAGAVTLYWVHVVKANHPDDIGIIPPIVFVSVGLGGLVGGVMGYEVYKAFR